MQNDTWLMQMNKIMLAVSLVWLVGCQKNINSSNRSEPNIMPSVTIDSDEYEEEAHPIGQQEEADKQEKIESNKSNASL